MRRSNERIGLTLITLLAVVLLATPALARDGDEGSFGLGIYAGEPTGLSAKYFFDEHIAIDGTVGWSFFKESALHLHMDVLWHFDDKPGVDDNPWAFMCGVGFRFKIGEEDELAGVRIPLGFTYAIGDTAMEAFGEAAPVINFGTAEDMTMNVAAGVHYYF